MYIDKSVTHFLSQPVGTRQGLTSYTLLSTNTNDNILLLFSSSLYVITTQHPPSTFHLLTPYGKRKKEGKMRHTHWTLPTHHVTMRSTE